MSQVQTPLADYAARLIRVIEAGDMTVLSGAGVSLPWSSHVDLKVEYHRPEKDQADGFRGGNPREPSSVRTTAITTTESALLDKLVDEDKPALIVAPFGSGKSVMLTSLALELCRRLEAAPDDPSIPVPLPVRLREWASFGADPNPDLLARWQEFLWKSQGLQSVDHRGKLTPSQVVELLEQGRLLPMLDGLDELPEVSDREGFSRPAVLQMIGRQRFAGLRYVLTCRPGYDAETFFHDSDGAIHIIPELSSKESDSILHRILAPALSRDRELILAARNKLEPDFSQFLCRPLLLAIWVRHARENVRINPEHLLRTLDGLMWELSLQCFDDKGRRQALQLPRSAHRAALDDVARVLAALAHAGFGRPAATADIVERLRSWGLPAGESDVERSIEIGEALGLIARQPASAAQVYAIKIPVAEYLAGRFLAGLATSNEPAKRKRFVELFRRWAWRPALYECIDFTMDILGTKAKPLAVGLIEWMLSVHRQKPGPAFPPQTRWPHPWCGLALRWAQFAGVTPEEINEKILADVLDSDPAFGMDEDDNPVKQLGRVWCLFLLQELEYARDDHYQSVQVVSYHVAISDAAEIVETLIRFHNDTADGEDKIKWRWVIAATANRVAASDAARIVLEWICRHDKATDSDEKEVWRRAIHSAANNAMGIVDELIRFHNDAWDPEEKQDWRQTIKLVASRVTVSDVAPIVVEWIHRHNEAACPYHEMAWTAAIESAASHVAESDAVQIVVEWIRRHNEAADSKERKAWQRAIKAVAGRVVERDAAWVVEELIRCHNNAANLNESAEWRWAIEAAADRVADRNAARIVVKWIRYCNDAADLEERKAWGKAIWTAAGRVATSDAARVVVALLYCHNHADSKEKKDWQWAIESAGRRVAARDAAWIVVECIRRHNKAVDLEEKRAWQRAIESIACRVAEQEVVRIVEELIRCHNQAADWEDKQRLQWPIRFAAQRVRRNDAARIVMEWVRCHKATSDPDEKTAWWLAIGSAAGRVANGDAVEIVVELMRRYTEAEYPVEYHSWHHWTIMSAANCVAERDAARCLQHWLEQYRQEHAGPKPYVLRAMIDDLLTRRYANAATEKAITEILLSHGEMQTAAEFVRRSKGIALVVLAPRTGTDAKSGKPASVPSGNLNNLEVRLRTDDAVVLDPGFTHAPVAIHDLFRKFPKDDGYTRLKAWKLVEEALQQVKVEMRDPQGRRTTHTLWKADFSDEPDKQSILEEKSGNRTTWAQTRLQWLVNDVLSLTEDDLEMDPQGKIIAIRKSAFKPTEEQLIKFAEVVRNRKRRGRNRGR